MSRPTETERCIESLIAVFQKYAGKDGNSCKLSKTEFLTFMNTELAAFTKVLRPAPPRTLRGAPNEALAEWLGARARQLAPTPPPASFTPRQGPAREAAPLGLQ